MTFTVRIGLTGTELLCPNQDWLICFAEPAFNRRQIFYSVWKFVISYDLLGQTQIEVKKKVHLETLICALNSLCRI